MSNSLQQQSNSVILYLASPTVEHQRALFHLLGYLNYTKDALSKLPLCSGPVISAFSDHRV
eukprot:637141-Hanusia_phi.AAC.1